MCVCVCVSDACVYDCVRARVMLPQVYSARSTDAELFSKRKRGQKKNLTFGLSAPKVFLKTSDCLFKDLVADVT